MRHRPARFQRVINDLYFGAAASNNDFAVSGSEWRRDGGKAALKTLRRHGVVVIRDFFDRESALALGAKLRDRTLRAKESIAQVPFHEAADYFAQTDLCNFRTYQEIAAASKPVLNVRSKRQGVPDGGFVDFFSIDRLFQGDRDFLRCRSELRGPAVTKLLRRVTSLPTRQMNLYVNQGVEQPRGLHIDRVSKSYKCFLYLSDVASLEAGPYTYVPGSQRGAAFKWLNKVHNTVRGRGQPTDIPLSTALSTPILGEAGTLIVSCQSGIHGGAPQAHGFERLVLVDNYY